jgi:hypothetical protein
VNEVGWLASDDLDALLGFVLGRASERKLRLFACACCRRVWHLLADPRSRQALEVAERYADGHASAVELATARLAVLTAAQRARDQAAWAVYWTLNRVPGENVRSVCAAAAEALARTAARGAKSAGASRSADAWHAAGKAEEFAQVRLLREVFGNPFGAPAVSPAWLTWHRGTVRHMAQSIYESRRFEELPILGDALEEAGCMDEQILAHCRGGGEHVRGCWVVDRLLGKE